MKKWIIVVAAGFLFTACSSTKKIPATNTTISNKPAEKPEEKKADTEIKANPTAKMGSVNGKWRFESASEKSFSGTAAKSLPEITFIEADKKVSGTTGCNNLNGFFFITGNQFSFSPLAVTMKACPDATVETFITAFFKNVGFYKVDGSKLYLYDKTDQNKTVVFAKQ